MFIFMFFWSWFGFGEDVDGLVQAVDGNAMFRRFKVYRLSPGFVGLESLNCGFGGLGLRIEFF